jgi:hypothetical protein
VDSSLDPRLGWIGSYPSLILSIALTDPIGLLNGYPKNEDPTHIRQSRGSIAWLLEDSLKFSDNKEYTATLWINGVPSSLVAIIPSFINTTCSIGSGVVQLNACDLITVQITFPNGNGGALADGACLSLSIKR